MPSNTTFNGDDRQNDCVRRRPANLLQRAFKRVIGIVFTMLATLVASIALLSVNGDVPVAQSPPASLRLTEISADGRLHVAIPSGYLHWFDGGDGLSGLEYDLLRRFAEHKDLTLELHHAANSQQALALLEEGLVQIAAGSLSQQSLETRPLRASVSFLDNQYQVVSADGIGPIQHLSQLVGRRVVVAAGSNSIQMLQTLTSANPLLQWQISATDSDEDLLARLSRGEIDVTITDTRSALIMQHHYPDLNLGYLFPESHPVVWALRTDCDPELETVLNQYITRELRHGTMAMLKERYTDPAIQQNYLNLVEFRSRVADVLPRYRHMFVEAASQNESDWRLIAALSYQESMWNPLAESPTGVQGLMQLTQDTADFLRVDRHDPAESIDGAARYLKRLRSRLPSTIQEPDRTWLALASYNLGPGHVDDALTLTAERGGNADRWIDVKDILPLLEDPQIAKTTRHGTARGNEALAHVNRVRSFYQVLTRLEDMAETHYQADVIREIDSLPSFVAVTTSGRAVTASHARWSQAIENHPAPSFVSSPASEVPKPEAVTYVDIQISKSELNQPPAQEKEASVWVRHLLDGQSTDYLSLQSDATNGGAAIYPVPDNGLFPRQSTSDENSRSPRNALLSNDPLNRDHAASALLSEELATPPE